MANVDAPNGFTPAYHLSGGVIRPSQYTIASAYNTSIFTGDVVTLVAAGTITQAIANPINVIGIFAGVSYKDTNSGEQKYSPYWPASTAASAIKAMVYDDPYIVYRAQTSGTVTDPDDIGGLFDLTVGTGSTTYGTSAMELDGAVATGSGIFRMLGFVDEPGNDPNTANGEFYVQFSGEHELLGSDGI